MVVLNHDLFFGGWGCYIAIANGYIYCELSLTKLFHENRLFSSCHQLFSPKGPNPSEEGASPSAFRLLYSSFPATFSPRDLLTRLIYGALKEQVTCYSFRSSTLNSSPFSLSCLCILQGTNLLSPPSLREKK